MPPRVHNLYMEALAAHLQDRRSESQAGDNTAQADDRTVMQIFRRPDTEDPQ